MSTGAENNPIGFLQALSQKHYLRFPLYKEVSSSGPDHCRQFTYKCIFEEFEGVGVASQKKAAKSEAAKNVIAHLRKKGFFEQFRVDCQLGNNSINSTEAGIWSDTTSLSKNPISALNEYSQQRFLPRARYTESSITAGVFICECKLMDKKTYGQASTKKAAKTEAALKMCIEFNIKCSGVAKYQQQLQGKNQDLFIGKNPISKLKEFCEQNPSYKSLEYIDLPREMNNFGVKCTLDSISSEGQGSRKKIEKSEAARNFLSQLIAQEKNSNGLYSAVGGLPIILNSPGYVGLPVRPVGHQVDAVLEDLSISSSTDYQKLEEPMDDQKSESFGLHLSSLSITAEPSDFQKSEKPTDVQKLEELTDDQKSESFGLHLSSLSIKEEPMDFQKSEKPTDVQKLEEPMDDQKSESFGLHLSSLSIKEEPTDFQKSEKPTDVQKLEEPTDDQKSQEINQRRSSVSRVNKIKTSESLMKWSGKDLHP